MGERLIPGAVLFDVPGRGPALRCPDGEIVGVALPEDTTAAVRGALAVDNSADAPAELGAFREAGFLGGRSQWPVDNSIVALMGSSVLVEALKVALSRAGAQPCVLGPFTERGDLWTTAALLSTELSTGGFSAVCAVSDGPAPSCWDSLDDLPEHGIAWQRVSREGRHALIEPVAAEPGDIRHSDIRKRRLAAAGSGHEHLSAFWAAEAPVTGEDAMDDLDAAAVASLAALDLRAWALGATKRDGSFTSSLPARRRLRVLDLDTAAITDHAVLRVPEAAS
ncbi:hypothetical protein [Allokutzneria sp. NRRL B-24872]|uniref:hypothetical protein n=1 Tax=Allokutzneria sp. NRRL B-24872 TaxID=1137961 RepID=UPI000A364DE7|nr:hypothetical protein [Allokutzneria sp. NRRL B-24872]